MEIFNCTYLCRHHICSLELRLSYFLVSTIFSFVEKVLLILWFLSSFYQVQTHSLQARLIRIPCKHLIFDMYRTFSISNINRCIGINNDDDHHLHLLGATTSQLSYIRVSINGNTDYYISITPVQASPSNLFFYSQLDPHYDTRKFYFSGGVK